MLENGRATHLLYNLQTLDVTDFDPQRAPITETLQDEKIFNLTLTDDYMYSKLVKEKPFNGMLRPTPTDIMNRFDDYLHSKNINPMSESQKRSTVGKLFKNYSIQSQGKRGRNLHYLMPEIELLRERFATNYGYTSNDLF